MKPKVVAVGLLVAGVAYLLYLFGTSSRGLVGPDEPRYAAIAREMEESGDWVTPRLDGGPWFEKPPLLYWLGALSAKTGLDDDRATRVPVALLSLAFLGYFYWQLSRYFGGRAAGYATLILGTSAGWVAFGQSGLFDIPLSVSLAAALLALLPWVEQSTPESRRLLPVFGALLGVSVLAKGLVGPAVAAIALTMVCWDRGVRSVARDLLHLRVALPFAVVALPWYLLSSLLHGRSFLGEFFGRHHFERFLTDSVQHLQPWWFFVPVLLIGLLPWTPLLVLYPDSDMRREPRVRFLIAWAVGASVFFSLSRNKLPGYILPVLPPVAALISLRLARPGKIWWPLAAAALTLALLPAATAVLPRALADGLRAAVSNTQVSGLWLAAAAGAAVGVGWAAHRGRRAMAVVALAACAAGGFIYLKVNVFPVLDRYAGTRALWGQIEPHAQETCLGNVRRQVRYGLGYYSHSGLPDCTVSPRPYRVISDPAVLVRKE